MHFAVQLRRTVFPGALYESVCEVKNNLSCSSLTFYNTGYFCCAAEMCDVRQDKHIYIEIIKDRTSLSLPHCVGSHPIWMLDTNLAAA